MELRSLEEEVGNMASSYEALRRSRVSDKEGELVQSLPPVVVDTGTQDQLEEKANSVLQVLSTLEALRDKRNQLTPKMDRYRRRLTEKDPVTGNPRYGATTMARVTSMLATFDALANAIGSAFGEDEATNKSLKSEVPAVVDEIRVEVQRQEEAARKYEEQQRLEKERQAEEAAQLEQQRLEKERQAEEAAQLSRIQEQEEIAQRARQARLVRQEAEQARLEQERRAREAAELADSQWVSSIEKGPDGVRHQLAVLRDNTEKPAYGVALNALHTLFKQIVSHPEETNFRRVRRDHPKFHDDIGRHAGGREILVAAGFQLSRIDDVPCFISTEPNIEKDMDGWSAWFDLLKATLVILEEELIKIKS